MFNKKRPACRAFFINTFLLIRLSLIYYQLGLCFNDGALEISLETKGKK